MNNVSLFTLTDVVSASTKLSEFCLPNNIQELQSLFKRLGAMDIEGGTDKHHVLNRLKLLEMMDAFRKIKGAGQAIGHAEVECPSVGVQLQQLAHLVQYERVTTGGPDGKA